MDFHYSGANEKSPMFSDLHASIVCGVANSKKSLLKSVLPERYRDECIILSFFSGTLFCLNRGRKTSYNLFSIILKR